MEHAPDLEKLVEHARDWMAQDPDEATREQMQRLLDGHDWAELVSCLTPLTFGTAGLRAVEGPGPGRMNRAVVLRTTRGLADYLSLTEHEDDLRPIVVGADARTHSMLYQMDAVAVLVALGFVIRFFERPVPTPLVAFAARVLGARAAICITASHNPREYAGFKLYAENAVQIVSPIDEQVAQAIAGVGPANQIARADADRVAREAKAVPESLTGEYLDAIDALRVHAASDRDFQIVYTALHGVGAELATSALRRAGYERVEVVPEQALPDPRFPTVRFPNPEEPGALDLARALADRVDAELLIANDPDADRLAVCVRDPAGPILQLTGNQTGVLLADYLLRHYRGSAKPLVVSSIVSSPMVKDVAAHYDASCLRTLTGFKWMLNAALRTEADSGACFVFGFEEALGYCVGHAVRDKDGISAAVAFADLVAECRAEGSSVVERLAELYGRHGLWASSLENLVLEPEALDRTRHELGRLVRDPPDRIGGLEVTEVVDFNQGARGRPWYLGATELIELRLAGRARVIVRPSGTEPKIKIYADYCASYDPAADPTAQRSHAENRAAELARGLRERLEAG